MTGVVDLFLRRFAARDDASRQAKRMDQEPAQTAQSGPDRALAPSIHALSDTLRFALSGRQHDGQVALVG